MKKKHIAIFAENLYGGGVEKILQIICRNFDYERYDVTLYSSRYEDMPEGTYPSNLQHKYYFDSFPHNKTALCRFLAKVINKIKLTVYYHLSPEMFYRLFIRERYDVGIAFIEGYATRIVSGAPEGMKKIAWIHIELDNFHWTDVAYSSREEEKKCYDKIDEIVCVSEAVMEQAKKIFTRNEHIRVLHNPIDVERILNLSKENVQIPNCKKSVRIIALGTLNKRKSFDRLLSVVNRLRNDAFDFETLILGDGPELVCLQQFINNNNLNSVVQLVGYIDNPYPYILSSDIYVCSSYAEGYNTAVSEAIILGKAVVSTEVSGIREQLGEHSEFGIITKNSEDGLYWGLKEMLSMDNLSKYKLKAKNRAKIFNLSIQMQLIYDLIENEITK